MKNSEPLCWAKRKGFTLIELLVVIAMITLLIGIIRPMLSAAASRSRDMECESRLTQVGMALRAYADDHGAFPADLAAVDNVLQDKSQLSCPGTGNPYFYWRPGKDIERDDIIVTCVDPKHAARDLPHARGQRYLALTAGGQVSKVRPGR